MSGDTTSGHSRPSIGSDHYRAYYSLHTTVVYMPTERGFCFHSLRYSLEVARPKGRAQGSGFHAGFERKKRLGFMLLIMDLNFCMLVAPALLGVAASC